MCERDDLDINSVVSSAEDIAVEAGLKELGINNVRLDRSLARGFDYYTGTIFEFKDTHEDNNRSLLGGGRYDNLTGLFGGEPISGIGFGFGDVTMRDFLETHGLMTANITSPTVMVIPMEPSQNLEGQKISQQFRQAGISVATDVSDRKVGKKISAAAERMVDYVLVLGEDEIASGNFVLKNLLEESEKAGSLETLIASISG